MTAFYIGPFQNIVNVGWRVGSPFAVLLFNAVWRNGVHNTDDFLVQTLGVGAANFNIYDHVDIKNPPGGLGGRQMILARGPFSDHTQSGTGPATGTETFYHYTVSTNDSFGQGWVRVVSTTSDEGTVTGWDEVTDPPTYAPVGISGEGDIGAFGAFKLANGWSTFGTDAVDGPHESGGGGTRTVFDRDNACIIFDIGQLKQLCPPGTTQIQFDMTVGAGPSTVHDPDHTGIIGYVWTATLRTFATGAFPIFTTNAENEPAITWPAPDHQAAVTSPHVQPTPSKTVRFVVNLADLSIVASSP